jgi:hypothetical protein
MKIRDRERIKKERYTVVAQPKMRNKTRKLLNE